MGTRLGLAALEAVADRFSREVSVVAEDEGSVTPITRYRRRFDETAEAPMLAAAREVVSIPLQPHPALEEIERERREYDDALEEARASGDRGRVKIAFYHASWARRIEAQLREGIAPTEVSGPVHAVRIGDGVIVTGPGETFTEYGIAVKERSPGRADAVRRLHERDPRLSPDVERVPVRRVRGGLRVQERRPAVALRPERRADPRRDRRAASPSACSPRPSRGTTRTAGSPEARCRSCPRLGSSTLRGRRRKRRREPRRGSGSSERASGPRTSTSRSTATTPRSSSSAWSGRTTPGSTPSAGSSGSRCRRARSTSCSPPAWTASSSPRRTTCIASTRSPPSRPGPTCSSRSR